MADDRLTETTIQALIVVAQYAKEAIFRQVHECAASLGGELTAEQIDDFVIPQSGRDAALQLLATANAEYQELGLFSQAYRRQAEDFHRSGQLENLFAILDDFSARARQVQLRHGAAGQA